MMMTCRRLVLLALHLSASLSPVAAQTKAGIDGRGLTVCFTGDLLLDRGVRIEIRRSGVDSIFTRIAPVLRRADFAVANLECPATDERRPLNKKYIFRAEPQWLAAVRRAGITHVSLANNHSNDQGREGIIATANHAAAHGLGVVGYGATQREARMPALLVKGRDSVAIFASVQVPLENWMYRDDQPGPSQATADELCADISAWKRVHPGCVAIAFLHWGWEYHPVPSDQQREDARALIRAGADAVIGHHPHVVQTIERIDGRPVFYSLGNFVFDNSREVARNGLVLKCTIADGAIAATELIPIRIAHCVPAPVVNAAAWFDRYLRVSSPDIDIAYRADGWFLKANDADSRK
jgi:poly-gamma-glutamate capsule biosynthesis protein CapA/YwtB (metallophosphatase superfamily)